MTAEQVYLDYHDRVFAYLRARLNSRETAEDLCSDVFLKVYQKLDGFDASKASLSTWIYTIARNTLTDFFRTNRPSEELPEDLACADELDDGVLQQESLSELANALKGLSQELRDIVILRYYKGHTLTEVARLMNLSYGMTKIKHQKALDALRQCMTV